MNDVIAEESVFWSEGLTRRENSERCLYVRDNLVPARAFPLRRNRTGRKRNSHRCLRKKPRGESEGANEEPAGENENKVSGL